MSASALRDRGVRDPPEEVAHRSIALFRDLVCGHERPQNRALREDRKRHVPNLEGATYFQIHYHAANMDLRTTTTFVKTQPANAIPRLESIE